MAKQQAYQKYVYKIHSTRLREAKWKLSLPLAEARERDEVISLNDSLMLRWIDELNGKVNQDAQIKELRHQISEIRKLPHSAQNRHKIDDIYKKIDEIQYVHDYVNVIMDKNSDMIRACKGFEINGIKYTRLLGTSGGVKNSTIIFVNERLAPELRRRIDNGRNMSVPMIPAKFEAYRALTCSGSIPVSMPHGILVVDDCVTRFKEDIIMLNDEDSDEPVMTEIDGFDVELTESDGYGLMLPSLAERWSQELQLSYVASGMNTRLSFEKGMVFTFDFIDFAEKVAGGKHIVKDVWGHDVDITQVELILTASMLKLWNSYDSIEHYLKCCEENHYTFGITKTCDKELDYFRSLNYQFIQSYDLTDEQIVELAKPTADEVEDVLIGDYRVAMAYLGKVDPLAFNQKRPCIPDMQSWLAVEPKLYDDPFVKKRLMNMLSKTVTDAKIGVLSVHGNYSILCGDPYALCQSVFGLPVTGLLKAGQLYNKYWIDEGAEYVACFRAPMSCHNNIRRMQVANSEEMVYWYRHMTTCTMMNAWDTTTQALNGAD